MMATLSVLGVVDESSAGKGGGNECLLKRALRSFSFQGECFYHPGMNMEL